MTTVELVGIFGGALSALLAIVVALIGVVYRNDQKAAERAEASKESRLLALEKQNTEQETRIATLNANASNHDYSMDRLTRAIEKLDDKIDSLTQSLVGRKVTPPPFPATR